jgi:hypothetical protein
MVFVIPLSAHAVEPALFLAAKERSNAYAVALYLDCVHQVGAAELDQ